MLLRRIQCFLLRRSKYFFYDEFRSICLYDAGASLYLYDIAKAYASMTPKLAYISMTPRRTNKLTTFGQKF
jgi:hypothetical protein